MSTLFRKSQTNRRPKAQPQSAPIAKPTHRPVAQPKAAKTKAAKDQRAQAKARQIQAHTLAQAVLADWHLVRSRLAQLDLLTLARQTGFMQRQPRKISPLAFLLGLLALSAETLLSLERMAAAIALGAKVTYTKQALHKRLGPRLEHFVAETAAAFFAQLARTHAPDLLRSFNRVLLQDSTVQTVPKRLARSYPGGRNQKKCDRAALKIQFIGDLLNGTVLHWSFSGFTRNDQAAAPDILTVAQRGDLIIRDLGYFASYCFGQLYLLGAFFLSRYRHGVNVYDLEGQLLDLVRELRAHGHLDRQVLLGQEKTPVRLVALPVPDALANARRRYARANHDGRSQPSQTHLQLLGWNIFITNVPTQIWSAQAVATIYRLRWRIEVVFKTWKSYLGLHRLNTRTGPLLGLSAAIKLLFCVLVYRQCHELELLGDGTRHVSLLRLARILEQCACLLMATILDVSPQAILEHHLAQHLYYDQRPDRKHFFDQLADLNTPLG